MAIKLRDRLLDMLGGIDAEKAFALEAEAEAKAHAYHKGKIRFYERYTQQLADENHRLREVVREMCRSTDTQYYDWACEFCKADCDKPRGWCRRFTV